jgi:DNA polymerase-3 subunit epsilon
VPCATALEAQVRELRLIAEHKPAYNRRSRAPEREPWLRLTDEPYPRLSVTRSVPADAAAIGPFTSRAGAEAASAALITTFKLRTCTTRLPVTPAPGASACALAEMGRCAAPCVRGRDAPGYAEAARAARAALAGDVRPVVTTVLGRIDLLAGSERYEEAGSHRDQLSAFLRAAARTERLDPLAGAPQVVAARPRESGGWEIVLIRHGRLAGTTAVPRGADPMPAIAALDATGEQVAPPARRFGAASAGETELLAAWLAEPGVRLVEQSPSGPDWAWRATGAAHFLHRLPGVTHSGR